MDFIKFMLSSSLCLILLSIFFTQLSIHGCAMTDAPTATIAGRSLWADAWARLKANKAAMFSAIYLAFVVFLCLVGPNLTSHEFSTQYPSYVRVPPSLEPYPKVETLDQEIKDLVRKAHLDLKEWIIKPILMK